MQSIKYSVIVVICISFLLTNVSFAQEPNSELSELPKYQKYQVEAKDPGTAALLGGIFGLGLGHYYVTGKAQSVFLGGELLCSVVIGIGTTMKEDVYDSYLEDETDEKEISESGKNLIGLGAVALVIIRILEPFSAYSTAVQHNQKLLDKYAIDLSLGNMDRSFRLTYRF